jgi:GTP-binding protein HflX
LITAFRATLEEMESSDVLLHLVDASSPQVDSHIASVEKILDELNLSGISRLLVYNKSDLLSQAERSNLRETANGVMISALDAKTLIPMVERISEMLESAMAARTPIHDGRQVDAIVAT